MRALLFSLLSLSLSCVVEVGTPTECGLRPIEPPFTFELVNGQACMIPNDYEQVAEWHVSMIRWAVCEENR